MNQAQPSCGGRHAQVPLSLLSWQLIDLLQTRLVSAKAPLAGSREMNRTTERARVARLTVKEYRLPLELAPRGTWRVQRLTARRELAKVRTRVPSSRHLAKARPGWFAARFGAGMEPVVAHGWFGAVA